MWQCSFSAVVQTIRSGLRADGPRPEDFFGELFKKYYNSLTTKVSIDATTASRWLNGDRPVSREIATYYSEVKGLDYLKDVIETSIIPTLSDPAKTVGNIHELVKNDNSISREKKTELSTSYSRKNDAEMAYYIATVLQFSMLRNDVKADDQSELNFRILNAHIPEPCKHFLGRKKELAELHDILKKSKNVFVAGIGGIGKSEFVKAYIKSYRKDFTDVLYFIYSGSLKKTIASMEVDGEKADLSEDEKFNKNLSILRKLSKKACLVIDNFDVSYTKDKNLQAILGLSCHVLFTTRSQFDSIQNEAVFTLNEITNKKELLELMANYYPDASSNRDTMLGIIDVVHSHTLSVELAARLLATGILAPPDLLSKLKNENVALDNSDEVVLTKDGKTRKATYKKHIHLLFSLFRLSSNQKTIMRCMAFVPLSGIPAALFSRFLGKDDNNEVNNLIERGLIRRGNDWLISLHPLITEVVVADLCPSITSCRNFLANIQSTILNEGITFSDYNALLSITDSIIAIAKNDDPAFFLRLLEDFFIYMEEYNYISGMQGVISEMDSLLKDNSNGTNKDRILLCDYRAQMEEDPKKALKLREDALKYAKEIVEKDENAVILVSNLYANIGLSHSRLNRYFEAIQYYERAIQLREHIPIDESLINIYINLSIALYMTGHQEAGIDQLNIIEEEASKSVPHTALHAKILQHLGVLLITFHYNTDRGVWCLKEALSIYKEIYRSRPAQYSKMASLIQESLRGYGIPLPPEYLTL